MWLLLSLPLVNHNNCLGKLRVFDAPFLWLSDCMEFWCNIWFQKLLTGEKQSYDLKTKVLSLKSTWVQFLTVLILVLRPSIKVLVLVLRLNGQDGGLGLEIKPVPRSCSWSQGKVCLRPRPRSGPRPRLWKIYHTYLLTDLVAYIYQLHMFTDGSSISRLLCLLSELSFVMPIPLKCQIMLMDSC